VYALKGRHSKGANRWCTSILHTLRAIKTAGGPNAQAMTLVLFGDNYAENKNNVNFDFLLELVWRGWYTTIHLLFGPVGHTHNGVDAQHRIHNVNCGKYPAGTIGQWCSLFPRIFTSRVPTPKYLRQVYDFRARYDKHSYTLSGFTKTANNPESAHGFKFGRGPNGCGGNTTPPYVPTAGVERKASRGTNTRSSYCDRCPGPVEGLTVKVQSDTGPGYKATEIPNAARCPGERNTAWGLRMDPGDA
jgi:hypothetical protein